MSEAKRVKIPELTAANYDWFVKEKRFALLYCGARWLADDAELREAIHRIAEVHADWMNVGAVDVDDVPNIARRVQLTNVPTVVYFEAGRIVEMVTGHEQNIPAHVEDLLARMDSAEREAVPADGLGTNLSALDLAAKRLSGELPAIPGATRKTGSRTTIQPAAKTLIQDSLPVDEPDVNAGRYAAWFFVLLALMTGLRVAAVLNAGLELSFDEAYYWHWSKQMDWSYFSKGPGVAAMIKATTAIAGDTEFGVRLGAIICSVLISIIGFYWAKSFFASARTALIAALIGGAAPMFAVGGMISTIDAPFFLCWTASTAAAWWAVTSNRLIAWAAVGVTLAAGLQCKFTTAFLLASLVLFSAISAPDRRMLLRAGFWVALVIAADSLLPLLLWNSRHDWITFTHTLDKAGGGPLLDPAQWPRSLGEQAAVISPVLLIGVVASCILCTRDAFREIPQTARFDGRRAKFLFAFFAPVFVFYILMGLHRHVPANWSIAGYLTGFAATAYYWGGADSWTGRRLGSFIAAVVLGILMLAPLAAGDLLYQRRLPDELTARGIPFTPNLDPTNRLRGNRDMVDSAVRRAAALTEQGGKPVFFLADHYKYASWIGFYGDARDRVHVLPRARPANQFDIWRAAGRAPAVGDNAIIVFDARDRQTPARADKYFRRVEPDPEETVADRAGYELRRYGYLRGYEFLGFAEAESDGPREPDGE